MKWGPIWGNKLNRTHVVSHYGQTEIYNYTIYALSVMPQFVIYYVISLNFVALNVIANHFILPVRAVSWRGLCLRLCLLMSLPTTTTSAYKSCSRKRMSHGSWMLWIIPISIGILQDIAMILVPKPIPYAEHVSFPSMLYRFPVYNAGLHLSPRRVFCALFQYKDCLLGMEIPIIKIGMSRDKWE